MKLEKRIVPLSLILFFAFLGLVFAQEFSADMFSSAGGTRMQGKMCVTKVKTRMETADAVTITRLDKGVVWMLMPAQKMYMEMPLKSNNVLVGKDTVAGEVERELVGREPIEGRLTEKYRVVYAMGNERQTVYTWISKDIGLPLKTAASDGSWVMEFKNIKLGKQAEDLFEVPQEYKKFSVPVSGMNTGNLFDSGSE